MNRTASFEEIVERLRKVNQTLGTANQNADKINRNADNALRTLGDPMQRQGDVILDVTSAAEVVDEEATNGWKWKIFMAVFIMQLAYYSLFLLTLNHKNRHDTFTLWWDVVTAIVGLIDLVLKRITSTGFTRTRWPLYLCNIIGYFPWIATHKLCIKAFKALNCKPWKLLKLLEYLIGLRAFFIVTVHCYLNTVEERMRHRITIIGILFLKFVVLTVFWVHFVACYYFGLAMIWPDPKDTWLGSVTIGSNNTCNSNNTYYDFNKEPEWKTYGICFYYSMTSITTVGYGDVHAVNILEMYAIPMMLFINLIFMTFIGSHFIGPLLARIFQDEKSRRRRKRD